MADASAEAGAVLDHDEGAAEHTIVMMIPYHDTIVIMIVTSIYDYHTEGSAEHHHLRPDFNFNVELLIFFIYFFHFYLILIIEGAAQHHHLHPGRLGQPHLHPPHRHLHLRHPGHAGRTYK